MQSRHEEFRCSSTRQSLQDILGLHRTFKVLLEKIRKCNTIKIYKTRPTTSSLMICPHFGYNCYNCYDITFHLMGSKPTQLKLELLFRLSITICWWDFSEAYLLHKHISIYKIRCLRARDYLSGWWWVGGLGGGWVGGWVSQKYTC